MTPNTSETDRTKASVPFRIILSLTLLVPLIVLPGYLENAFFAPKYLILLLGAFGLTALYATRFVFGRKIPACRTSTPYFLVILITLNFVSFFYTANIYYTRVAALLNIACLLLIYFTALYLEGKALEWLMAAVGASGLFIAAITYLQFSGCFIIFKFMHPGDMVTATIGNSNYLGAYLLFPLFAVMGIAFRFKGKLRILLFTLFLFLLGALLISRARASWLGFTAALPFFLFLTKKIFNISILQYIRSRPGRMLGYAVTATLLMFFLFSLAPRRFQSMLKYKSWATTTSLHERMKYDRASWALFTESPLFGTGLWSFRNRVYDAQAEINLRDPGYFKDYTDPKPRRVHCEYLEILNDGGLTGAVFLLILLVTIMRHGGHVVRDKKIPAQERVLVAASLSAITGTMVAALFFFPFRLPTTLFNTALMLGILEGAYLHKYGLVTDIQGKRLPFCHAGILAFYLILIGLLVFRGYRPLEGGMEFHQYKTAVSRGDSAGAERHLLAALSRDPGNSLYCLYAAQLYMDVLRNYVTAAGFFEKALHGFNGDLSKWAVYYGKGILKLRTGALFEARQAFRKALYYNPNYMPAKEKLNEVEKILKDHDSVVIKFK